MQAYNAIQIRPEDRLSVRETKDGLIELIAIDLREDSIRVKIIIDKQTWRNLIRTVFRTVYTPEEDHENHLSL